MKKLFLLTIAFVAFTTTSYAQWYSSRGVNFGGLVNILNSKGYVDTSYAVDQMTSSCTTQTFPEGGSTDRITFDILRIGLDHNDIRQRYGSVTLYVDVPNNRVVLENNSSVSVGLKISAKWKGSDGSLFIKANSKKSASSSFYDKNMKGKDVRFTKIRLTHCNGLDK